MDNRLDIGFLTSGYRTIKDGKEFDRFFTSPDGNDRVIRDGDVFETVDLMKTVVWKYIDDTKEIAAYLKGTTLKQTCENTWNFLYHHIQYKLDEKGMEQLRRPNRSWAERKTGIDCDCFSIFVSSILTNLQIPHSFRITKYNRDTYQHVYVIVPISGSTDYYIIDCVLSRFNYEKPFTANKDFPMSLDKINIAVLSGTETDVMDVIAGLDELDEELLGADSEAQRSQAIFDHLVKTRNLIVQKPYLIAQVDYPPAFIQMLDYAIASWHTPNRTAALENLARNEDVLNRMSGMDGVPDETELDGTDDLWSHLDGLTLGEIQEELNGKARKAKKKNKKGFFRKVGQAVKKGVKKAAKAVVRFNPISIAARNGFLLAMKLNVKKMASKLKWGYATKEQAAAKKISAQQWEKSKNALAKVEKLFADKLQGKRSALKNAILKGKAGGINGLAGPEEEIDLRGLGIAPAAALAAAAPVIAMALKIISGEGLMKNDEAQKAETDINAKASEADVPAQDASVPASSGEQSSAAVATAQEAAPAAAAAVQLSPQSPSSPVSPSSSDEMVISPRPAENTDSGRQEETPSQDNSENVPAPTESQPEEVNPEVVTPEVMSPEPEGADSTDSTAAPSETENTESSGDTIDGLFDFVQSKPLLIAGGIGLGIWGLTWLLNRNKKSEGLSGPPAGRKKKKVKKKKRPSRQPTRKKAGRKTIKAITLR